MNVFEKRLVRATSRVGGSGPASWTTAGDRVAASSRGLAADRRVMVVWLRLLEAHNLIMREVRRGLAGVMTLPQFDALVQLDQVPDGLTLAELSRRLRVTAANVTGIVARLEQSGWVLRREDPRDGRAFRVSLTVLGRRHLHGLIPQHAKSLTRVLDGLDIEDQLELQDLLERIGEGISGRPRSSAASPAAQGRSRTAFARPRPRPRPGARAVHRRTS